MCGGSFMSGIGQQVGSALGGGANPLQNSNTGGGLMGGGMPAPMQNPFLGGQPQGMMPPPPIPPAPQGPGAGPTSQPQTMQDRLARASELLGTRGGGMGQPYITDRGYFGPGTMSNPTGPQFGQEGVVTQVSRPPVDVPYTGQGAGPTSQPQTMQDRLARASELLGTQYGGMGQPYISDRGYFGPGTMSNPTGPQYGGQDRVVTSVNRPLTDVPQYGGQDRVVTQVARPLTDVPQYGGGMGQPMPLQVDRPLTGVPQYGGGMGQPRSAEDAWRLHSAMALYAPGTDMAKEKQNFIANYNARQGVPQPGAGIPPEMLQKLLQGTPSGANGPYPAQVSTLPFQPQQISLQQQQQSLMDRLNQQFGRQMQPYQQQMEQLQQRYMGQPPQELLRFDQEFQKMPEYQAMQKAAQSGNIQEADRLRNAFESSPQFKQFELTRNAYEQQQQQARQKMMADPRFNQLQNRMQELQRRQQRLIQARQPQPAQGLTPGIGSTGIANLLRGMMF